MGESGKQGDSYRPTSLKKLLKKVQVNLLKRKVILKGFKSELKASVVRQRPRANVMVLHHVFSFQSPYSHLTQYFPPPLPAM